MSRQGMFAAATSRGLAAVILRFYTHLIDEAMTRRLHAQAFHDAGWTRQEVINIPNALSMGRLLSGPVVAHMILQHQWPAAMVTLAVAGISDWADGYAAKHWGQSSVLGSYLDPLADKVLVCCTVGALAAEVCLPPASNLCFRLSSCREGLVFSLSLCCRRVPCTCLDQCFEATDGGQGSPLLVAVHPQTDSRGLHFFCADAVQLRLLPVPETCSHMRAGLSACGSGSHHHRAGRPAGDWGLRGSLQTGMQPLSAACRGARDMRQLLHHVAHKELPMILTWSSLHGTER